MYYSLLVSDASPVTRKMTSGFASTLSRFMSSARHVPSWSTLSHSSSCSCTASSSATTARYAIATYMYIFMFCDPLCVYVFSCV